MPSEKASGGLGMTRTGQIWTIQGVPARHTYPGDHPYGQLGWVVVTCACDALPSRRPRTLKRQGEVAVAVAGGKRLSGSLAGDSGDHHQYQRRGIVSCDDY